MGSKRTAKHMRWVTEQNSIILNVMSTTEQKDGVFLGSLSKHKMAHAYTWAGEQGYNNGWFNQVIAYQQPTLFEDKKWGSLLNVCNKPLPREKANKQRRRHKGAYLQVYQIGDGNRHHGPAAGTDFRILNEHKLNSSENKNEQLTLDTKKDHPGEACTEKINLAKATSR